MKGETFPSIFHTGNLTKVVERLVHNSIDEFQEQETGPVKIFKKMIKGSHKEIKAALCASTHFTVPLLFISVGRSSSALLLLSIPTCHVGRHLATLSDAILVFKA